jgi:acyl carrier protein
LSPRLVTLFDPRRAAGPAPNRPTGPLLKENDVVSTQDIEEKVIAIVCEQMGASKDKVNLTTSFIQDLGADSLDTVELVMEFEDHFNISIPDEEAEKIQTVGDAVNFIVSHTNAA